MDRVSELLVEVRDPALARVAQVDHRDITDMTVTPRLRNVGAWALTLDLGGQADLLRQPGYGLVVTLGADVLMSGPAVAASRKGRDRTWSIAGVSDDVILADARAWPSPATTDLTAQSGTAGSGYDKRTGAAETVIRGYVDSNLGPSAPVGRRRTLLDLATDLGRGAAVSAQARFDVLGELADRLGATGGLGWRVRQNGARLLFECYTVADKSALVRFDADVGTLDDFEYSYASPGLTRAIVAGGGLGAARTLRERTSAASLAAESLWGRRVETFIDQRQTTVAAELDQAGDEALADGGSTVTGLRVDPVDTDLAMFGRDYQLGDRVTVVVDDVEVADQVTEATLTFGPGGMQVAASVGDPDLAVRDPLLAALLRARTRLGRLERRT